MYINLNTLHQMEKQYFRVELGPVDTAVIYDTTTKNYGQSLNFAPYVHYLQVYLSVMKSNNISADILPIISNNIYNLQDDYLNQLSQAIVDEEYIDLYELDMQTKIGVLVKLHFYN